MLFSSLNAALCGLLLAVSTPVLGRYDRRVGTNISHGFDITYPSVPSTFLAKRNPVLDQAAAKGCANLQLMAGTLSAPVPQSPFTDVAALEDNGWTLSKSTVYTAGVPSVLRTAFTALGFSSAAGDNTCILAQQNNGGTTRNSYGSTAANVVYEGSKTFYEECYNVKDGVIVATDNKYDKDAAQQPPLIRLSDVVGLLWQDEGGSSNLNYIFRYDIRNADTINVIDAAISPQYANVYDLPDWPGVTYSMGDTRGKAILGTANGNGVAFLLAQHQQLFGSKLTVESVNLFLTDEDQPQIAFKIVQYVPPSSSDDTAT